MAQDPKSRNVPDTSVPENEGESASLGTPKIGGTPRASSAKPAKRATGRAYRSTSNDAVSNGAGRSVAQGSGPGSKGKTEAKAKKPGNRVRETRIERMMSKAELARRAGLSVLTIDRVEKGLGCRMDTKRKILESLGLSLVDRIRVFGEEE
jgi:DNA-binding XRE family transcriptional regulator